MNRTPVPVLKDTDLLGAGHLFERGVGFGYIASVSGIPSRVSVTCNSKLKLEHSNLARSPLPQLACPTMPTHYIQEYSRTQPQNRAHTKGGLRENQTTSTLVTLMCHSLCGFNSEERAYCINRYSTYLWVERSDRVLSPSASVQTR